MALLTLFTTTRAKIDAIELDCSVQETHERLATLTQSPVEDGSTISDHVVLLPRRLTIEGIVSKTPLGAAGLIGSAFSFGAGIAAKAAAGSAGSNSALAQAAAQTGVGSIAGLVSSAAGLSRDPVDVFKALEELWLKREPFTVVTALTGGSSLADKAIGAVKSLAGVGGATDTVLKNMVMTSLSVPRSKDTVNVLRFTATLEQVIVVANANLASVLASVPGASTVADLGKQAATTPSAGVFDNGATALSNLTGLGALP